MTRSGRPRQPESDELPGAPEWMVTFSDCMTLLLTFFVLLLSFSSFDNKDVKKTLMALARGLPSAVGTSTAWERDAFLAAEQVKPQEEPRKGSERPTLDGQTEGNTKEDMDLLNFHNRRVFLTSSDNIFWARGTHISAKGREILSDMAALLRTVPNRIVVSENGQADDKSSGDFGLQRAWAVTEYLATEHGVDKMRFSISAASTVPEQDRPDGTAYPPKSGANRMLEITILERSIYN
jgi:chemotaxis protein MotB